MGGLVGGCVGESPVGDHQDFHGMPRNWVQLGSRELTYFSEDRRWSDTKVLGHGGGGVPRKGSQVTIK